MTRDEIVEALNFGGTDEDVDRIEALIERATADLRVEVERLRHFERVHDGWKVRAEAAEAKVARVEALWDSEDDEIAYHWCRECGGTEGLWNALRAALNGGDA